VFVGFGISSVLIIIDCTVLAVCGSFACVDLCAHGCNCWMYDVVHASWALPQRSLHAVVSIDAAVSVGRDAA
jgi:hypothetical protein